MSSLPNSLGYFVKSAGARPFSQTSIVAVTENKPALQSYQEFGLSAFFRNDIDSLEILVGQRSDGLSFSSIASGTLGLYRVQPGCQTDTLLRSLDFEPSCQRYDKSYRFYMTSPGAPDEQIWVACELTLKDGTTVFKDIPLLTDENQARIHNQNQRVGHLSSSQDVSWEHKAPATVAIRALDDLAETPLVQMNFTDQPLLRYDDGTLIYAGGGNRFLVGTSSIIYQDEDTAPWDLGMPVFLESTASNLLPHAGMNVNYGTWDSLNDPVVVETREVFTAFGDAYRMAFFTASSPKQINSTWTWRSDKVAFDGNTVTGSMFVYANSDDADRLKFELVLQVISATGSAVLFEGTKQLAYTDIKNVNVHEVNWCKETSATAVAGYVQLLLRVSNFNPGDRFMLGLGFPQVEYGKTASTRIPSGGTRQRDQLIYLPSSSYLAEMDFGAMQVTWAPLYEGAPDPAGDQILFDTRDSLGKSGIVLKHTRVGLFVARLVDAAGTFAEVSSASLIPLENGVTYKTIVYWDDSLRQMRIDINGSPLVTKTFMAFPNMGKVAPTRILFGCSYLEQENPEFKLFGFEHKIAKS